MRIFFFETTNATPHLETSFELALKHLNKGDEVYYYYLGESVPYSEMVSKKKSYIIPKCTPQRKAAELLACENFKYFEPNSITVNQLTLPSFDSEKNLRSFKYKGYNAGLSALSSLIFKTKNSQPNLHNDQEIIHKILISGISIYEFILTTIESSKPDLIYLFNGRFANNRAILDAAIQKKIKYLIHERGADKNKYIARSFMSHDIERVRQVMLNSWKAANQSEALPIARKFFENKREGLELGWKSFILSQKKGVVVDDFVNCKKLITYYSSSDDEYKSVGDMVKWDRWPDQLTAVKDLISIISKYQEFALAIRIHPHLSEKHPAVLKEWLELELPKNARIIKPDDEVDTYAQMEKSDLVVTSVSTVGIESVYWGTPSICLGPSLYSHLDAVYLPRDKTELEDMLIDDSLSADSTKALPYGYYMATFGEEFKFYKAESLKSGKFLGVNLQSQGFCKQLRRIYSLLTRFKRMFNNAFSIEK